MWLLVITVLVLYFLPTIVAVNRGNPSALAIFIVNLIAAWTGVCWIIALVWACSGRSAKTRRREALATEAAVTRAINASRL
jgi:threonine/homoserine/homoserine lactone efflux protein